MKMVIKEIDGQGRVVIPYEWREEEGLMSKSKVELTKENGKILIKPMKYKSLMEVRLGRKSEVGLKEIEKAESRAAVKRQKKAER